MDRYRIFTFWRAAFERTGTAPPVPGGVRRRCRMRGIAAAVATQPPNPPVGLGAGMFSLFPLAGQLPLAGVAGDSGG